MAIQLPAHLQNRSGTKLAEQTAAHLGAGSPPFISIQGNRFTLIDATGAEQPIQTFDPQIGVYLDCVIADAGDVLSKIFYDKPFDPNAGQYEPPACFSDNGIGPSRNASRPQARTCAECPNAVWGSKTSAVSGKAVKACSDYQKLAIMVPGDEVTFLLRTPPNSLSNLRNYLNKFVGTGVDVTDVITRIYFDPNGLGTLLFAAPGQFITPELADRRDALRAAKKTDMLVGRGDQPRPPELAAPAGGALLGYPQQTPPQQAPGQFAQPAEPAFNTGSAGQQGYGAMNAAPSAQPEQFQQPIQQAPAAGRRPRKQRNTAAAQNPAPAPAQAQQPAFQPSPGQSGVATSAPSNFGMHQPQAAPDAIMQEMDAIFGPAQ